MNSIEQRLQRAALLASGIDAFGTGSFVSAAAVIFSSYNHVSAGIIGLGLTFSAVSGMIASMPAEYLADRIGGLRVFTYSYLLRAVGMLGWLTISGNAAFLVYMTLFGIIDRSAASLTRGLIIAPLSREQATILLGPHGITDECRLRAWRGTKHNDAAYPVRECDHSGSKFTLVRCRSYAISQSAQRLQCNRCKGETFTANFVDGFSHCTNFKVSFSADYRKFPVLVSSYTAQCVSTITDYSLRAYRHMAGASHIRCQYGSYCTSPRSCQPLGHEST